MLAANCGRDQRGAVIVEVTIVMTCPTRVAGVDVSSGELSPGAGPNIPDRTSGADCSAEIDDCSPRPRA